MSFRDKAASAIREAGGRMTAQREQIIDLLAHSSQRLDAESIYDVMRGQDASISLATVYRTLSALEAAGLLRQHYISKDHERKYYETAADAYPFTCRECRTSISFQSDHIAALKQELQTRYGLADVHICTCVDGICPACQTKRAPKK